MRHTHCLLRAALEPVQSACRAAFDIGQPNTRACDELGCDRGLPFSILKEDCGVCGGCEDVSVRIRVRESEA